MKYQHLHKSHQFASQRMTWNAMLTIEILFSIGVLGILIGFASEGYGQALIKAQFADVFSSFAHERFALEEQFALTGEGMPTVQARLPGRQSGVVANKDDIEDALGYKERPSNVATKQSAERDESASSDVYVSTGYFDNGKLSQVGKPGEDSNNGIVQSVRKIDSSLVLDIKLDSSGKQYFLAFTPSVIEDAIPGSIIWLCGTRQPQGGWVRLPGVSGTDLPDEYLVNNCRNSKEH